MKTTPLLFLLLTAALTLPLNAQDSAITAEVCGVQVISKVYPEGASKSGAYNEKLVPFNTFEAGVSIALLLSAPQGGITAIDTKASKIDTFADDKGTVLWDAKDKFNGGFGSFPKVSPDGKAGIFTVEGKIPAAREATSITAKGTVAVTTATKKSSAKAEKVALKKGTPVKAGPLTFTVDKADPGSNGVAVDLKTTDSLAKLVEIRFLGPDGKAIKAEKNGTSSFSAFGGPKTTIISYELETKLATVTVEVESWDDLKEVNVPFSATVATGVKK